MYAAANDILGRVPKVTPSSKVVGDLALHLAAVKADPADFAENPQNYDIPDSVVGFMAGELGDLPGGWPEPFRTKVLQGREVKIDVTPLTPAESSALESDATARRDMLNRLLFPAPTRTFHQVRDTFGDLSVLDTVDYLYGLAQGSEHVVEIERGVQLFVGPRGDRRGRRQGHAHGDDDAERAASPGVRAGSQHPGRRAPGREGRHHRARVRSPLRSRAS